MTGCLKWIAVLIVGIPLFLYITGTNDINGTKEIINTTGLPASHPDYNPKKQQQIKEIADSIPKKPYESTSPKTVKVDKEKNEKLEKVKALKTLLEAEVAKRKAIQATWGKWDKIVDTSKLDDSKTITLFTDSNETVRDWIGKKHQPTLILRCKENKTEAYIKAGFHLVSEYGHRGEKTLRYRYDKTKAQNARFTEATDNRAFFFPRAIGHIKRMLKHDQLLVAMIPFKRDPVELTFELKGLKEILPELRKTCNW